MVDLAPNALATLEDLLDELSLDADGGAQDNRLRRYINMASDFIAQVCSRKFERADAIAEGVRTYGGTELIVKRTPVLSVTSITWRGDVVDASTYSVSNAEAGFIFRACGWPWSAGRMQSITWPQVPGTEAQSAVVTYSGGWVTPVQAAAGLFSSAPRTLPYDLEDAVLQLAASRFHRQGTDVRVEREDMMSYYATYGTGPDAGMMSPIIRALVERYGRMEQA